MTKFSIDLSGGPDRLRNLNSEAFSKSPSQTSNRHLYRSFGQVQITRERVLVANPLADDLT